MPTDWAPFADLVARHERFLLTTHVRPDGDGLGSVLALTDALERLGKHVRAVVASAIPGRYDFLNPGGRVGRFRPPGADLADADAVVVLDTGTWNQLGDFGDFLRSSPAAKAVIDHHMTQDDLGAVRFVDTTAEATGRLVYEAVAALGVPLSREAAHGLFVALAMDTGWFRHPNATPRTFELAADLVRAGAEPTRAYESLFERGDAPRLRLLGRALDRMTTTAGGRVAWTEIFLADFDELAAHPSGTEDVIDYTRRIDGVEVGLMFVEQVGGAVKVSFRSRAAVDVARVAESFGGGGHRLASGATVAGPVAEVRERVLAAVTAALPGA